MADQPHPSISIEEQNGDQEVESVGSGIDGTVLDSTAPSPTPNSAAMRRAKSFNVHVQAPLPRGFVPFFFYNF